MSIASTTPRPSYLDALEPILTEIIAPTASEIDRTAAYPQAALDALARAGLLGLVSAKEVGGLGEGIRAATLVVEQIARHCASTALVVCMHYAAGAVIEAHGPRAVREAIAEGRAVTTLAFSEAGSRSHFWAPVSTATASGESVRLDARKSWITAAGKADLYVWSSRPLAAEGMRTLWLLADTAEGLRVTAPFDGLRMRGKYSSPVTADGVMVSQDAMLGDNSK